MLTIDHPDLKLISCMIHDYLYDFTHLNGIPNIIQTIDDDVVILDQFIHTDHHSRCLSACVCLLKKSFILHQTKICSMH